MKIKNFLPFIILTSIMGIFFYQYFIFGKVPFPGDLLISEYNPWRSYSFLGYNPGSYPNKAQYFDVLRQLYPWKTEVINQFKSGDFPLWNPYSFSGTPLLANFQSAAFYPLNILYFILPQVTAWSMLIVLQSCLSILFTYLYVRKIGISIIGSVFASITFGFSAFSTVWLEYNTIGHVILWLPLIMLSIEHILEKPKTMWLIAFVFSIVSSLLGGHPQIFSYLLIFISIYFFFQLKKEKIAMFLTLLIVSIGIGAIQLLPGFELISQSARSVHPYEFLIEKILIQPWQLIMLFVPDFFGNPATRNYWLSDTYVGKITYIGLVSILLSLLSLKRYKNRYILFFLVSTLIIFLLTSSNPLTWFLYKFSIPLISTSSPTLSIFIASFSLSILTGFGIDIFLKEKLSFKNYLIWILPIIILFILLWLTIVFFPKLVHEDWIVNLSISSHNLLYSTMLLGVVFILIGIKKLKKVSLMLIILLFIIQSFDLFRSFNKFNPFVPKELVFQNIPLFEFLKNEAGIDRFWGYGSGYIEANFSTQYGLFSPDGYDPLYPRRYGEFMQSARNGKIEEQFTVQTRSDAVLAQGFGVEDLPSNKYRLKVLDTLGVKYVFDKVENGSSDKTFPKDRFQLIYNENGWKVFKNLKATPRVFLSSDYQIFKTKDQFEKLFFADSFNPSRTILLEDSDQNLYSVKNNTHNLEKVKQSISVVSYRPEKVMLNVKTDQNALLFLSDVYYPGWKAFVDGNDSKIYRADYVFRAIFVPKGNHIISFVFDSESFKIGRNISLASLLFVLIPIFYFRKYEK